MLALTLNAIPLTVHITASVSSMPSFAPTNGSSTCFIIGNTPDDYEGTCRECKNIIMCALASLFLSLSLRR